MTSMRGYSLRDIAFILIVVFLWSSGLENCNSRERKHCIQRGAASAFVFRQGETGTRGSHFRQHKHGKLKSIGGRVLQTQISVTSRQSASAIVNVLNYGAKGDGKTDDTKAFRAAWAVVCNAQASTLVVPSGFVFLVGPISFSGPNCQPNIVFQLDGKLIAPTSSGPWGSGLLQWIQFSKLQGITIRGKGVIDGQGWVWWRNSASYSGALPRTRPTGLRFYGSNGVSVTGITIQNSPQTHLKFDSCTTVQVSGLTVTSPGTSPNTDGIHLQNSQNVVIYSSNLACGDDCVSIQTGCSNVFIHDINCGSGHGISIGGLGMANTAACVSNVTVRDVSLQNTMTGVRIKTWQGGSGSVQGITFANIQVSQVETPIMIDQYFCNNGRCSNQTSAVAISDINYINIRGAYTEQPVHFACSDAVPCTGLSLDTIQLTSSQGRGGLSGPFCWKAYGNQRNTVVPPVACLQWGNPSTAMVHGSC